MFLRAERELDKVSDSLLLEHPNLSAKNAKAMLKDYAPPGTMPQVRPTEAGKTPDVEWVDANGTKIGTDFEVKALTSKSPSKFSQRLSDAVAKDNVGAVVIQVPPNTDVSTWMRKFWRERRKDDAAFVERMKGVTIEIQDSAGRILLPRQSVYKPPG